MDLRHDPRRPETVLHGGGLCWRASTTAGSTPTTIRPPKPPYGRPRPERRARAATPLPTWGGPGRRARRPLASSAHLPTHQLPNHARTSLREWMTPPSSALPGACPGRIEARAVPGLWDVLRPVGPPSFSPTWARRSPRRASPSTRWGPTIARCGTRRSRPSAWRGLVAGAADAPGPGRRTAGDRRRTLPASPSDKPVASGAIGALDAQGVDVTRAPVTVGVMADGFRPHDHLLDGVTDSDKPVP